MRLLIFLPFLSMVSGAQVHDESLPFSTEHFPIFLEQPMTSAESDVLALSYADHAEHRKKRLRMKSMFHLNGPPAIGEDLFSTAAVEENVKKLSYEGSGSAVEENLQKSEDVATTSTMVSAELSYTANNSTEDEAVNESPSNSSLHYDQNTSDSEVATISDTVYQKNEAILQASQTESDNKAEQENVVEDKPTSAPIVVEYSEQGSNPNVTCPRPRMCKKNCFVTIDENGCQGCQCMWIAADCQTDNECIAPNQYCDLGKCNCKPGFQQNMRLSGFCEVAPPKMQGNMVTENGENSKTDNGQVLKRSKRSSKPRRSERLEWPGVCDKNEQCPENLVCIHGDCWSIPDKTRRAEQSSWQPEAIISRNTDGDLNRKISFDTDEIMEPSSLPPITTNAITESSDFATATEPTKRGMSRFVSVDFAKQLQRTTAKVKKYDWFPPTTTVTPLITRFPMNTNPVPPLTVDHFVMIETTTPSSKTTRRKIENDHKMEYMKERKPNFLGVKEEASELEYQMNAQSHIKKIHLEMPTTPTLLPHRKKHKKLRSTTAAPDDSSEDEEMTGVDEIEFPISSRIKIGSHKPRALSAEPTREELKDHKSLVDLFNSHASRNEESHSDDVKPSFQILQSFNSHELETTPDIQVSLANEIPGPTFSPIPDLLSGDLKTAPERKPYIIRHQKFTTIDPLSNISGDMASDDPPEITPEPAPFEQHQMGVWYPMKKGDVPHLGIFSGEFRRSPRKRVKTADDMRLYNEYTKANRKNRPIRIEMDNAAPFVRNECRRNEDCGTKNICCTKKWCDRTNNCGTGRFCLPYCDATKLTFLPSNSHAESVIDIMYD